MKRFFIEIKETKKSTNRHHTSFYIENENFKFVEKLVSETGRSMNYILNKCLEFARNNYEGVDN